MQNVLEPLQKIKIVPIVVIHDENDAAPLARALYNGGIPCAEVTFRTKAAEKSIRIMTEQFPDMLIGAGTVLTSEQADLAVSAGAKFIVSPGFNPDVVKHCVKKKIPIIPGINNPSGIEAALSFGINTVKFFPSVPSGGLDMIKALAAPYPQVKFMPTGGINPKNFTSFLEFEKVFACGGSWMVKEELIKEGKFDEIEHLASEAVAAASKVNTKSSGIPD